MSAVFPAPAIGVAGVVFNGEAVLLIRRNQAPAAGQWSIPGGKLEPGETLTAACKREIHEETGIEVEIRQIVAVVERRLENFHYVIVDFLAEPLAVSSQQPRAASDVSAARWVPLSALGDYALVAGLEEIIRRAARHRHGAAAYGLSNADAGGTDFILP